LKISRELWVRIEPMLEAALEMDPPARAAWLEGLDAARPDVAPALRRLLATHERAERCGGLESGPRLPDTAPWSSSHAPGEVVGPFALLRPLGHGGMGEVWLARQVDGRLEREVALKLPGLHQQGAHWRERFRRERDILARLAHPHIARLYDAGVSSDGQPWLAMEHVEGRPLDEHVRHEAPSIPQRLALFRQVLDAVAHAHRHLVVHRDLKPANILIDGAGRVKLLDFGIAKLLEEERPADADHQLTRIGGRVMTLRYAAPEQLTGEPIGTATDVYALGVILHELITGVSPYRAIRESRAITDSALLAEHPAAPSAIAGPVARQVRGDLDAIILKAMRRDPAARYASVERFDEDIERHLDRRPVAARRGTWRYLAGRFAARHKFSFAAGAAVLFALLAGLVAADHERRTAEAQRARAERHFASVRKLANTLIFEVHAQLENLPGSLKARETLVGTALEYLDALAAESAGDPALMFELAVAYRTIGDIQGQARIANLGDPAAAMRNYEKAHDLFLAVERVRPVDASLLRERWKLGHEMARGYFMMSDARWEPQIAAALAIAERLAALPGATAGDRALVASALCERAHIRTAAAGFDAGAEADIARGVDLVEHLARASPRDLELRTRLATCRTRAGVALSRAGTASLPRSIEHLRRARELRLELALASPTDAISASAAAAATAELAAVLGLAGDQRQADAMIAEALALNAEQRARDPANVELVVDRLGMLQAAARIAYRLGERERAMRIAREALAIPATVPAGTQRMRDVIAFSADARIYLGFSLLELVEEGKVAPERRLETLRESRRLLVEVRELMADFQARKVGKPREDVMRDVAAALERCDQALLKLAKG
jgi:tetratricopeptide (TPR) repeat protein